MMHPLRHLNLRTKILVGFGITLALVLIVWIWAILNVARLGNASQAILQENYRSILAAENMINTLERQESAVFLLLLGAEAEGAAQFHQNEVEFLQWLSRAQDNITIAGEADILSAIETNYLAFLDGFAHLRQVQSSDLSEAFTYYRESVQPIFQEVRSQSLALRELNQSTMVSASVRAQTVATRAIWSTAGVGAVAVAVGLAFSLWLSNILVQPLRAMGDAAEQIAAGTYDVTLPVNVDDELGHLAQKIMTMSHTLKAFHELNVGQVMAEKRRSEAIIRSITDGVIVVDEDFKIIAINPVAVNIFDTTVEAAQGQHFVDVVQRRALYEHVKLTAETQKPPTLSEAQSTFTIQRGEHTVHYHFTVTPVRTQEGRTLGVVLLLQDVTTLKELDRLKSEFVMTASHELRTPLTGMAMSIGLLREDASAKLSEREQELLATAEEDVTRLRHLVDDLLDLSKIESGRMEMEFQEVDVEFLLEQATAMLEEQAEQKEITLSFRLEEDIPPIQADPNKIAWVLTNLIGNALRYTDAGGWIRVAAAPQGRFAAISVSDNGTGIPLEYQSKIFDKFVQVKGVRSTGGTGLGLAICKEVVKAHGGTIWVSSRPGEGSTFTFTIPLTASGPTDAHSQGKEARENGREATHTGRG